MLHFTTALRCVSAARASRRQPADPRRRRLTGATCAEATTPRAPAATACRGPASSWTRVAAALARAAPPKPCASPKPPAQTAPASPVARMRVLRALLQRPARILTPLTRSGSQDTNGACGRCLNPSDPLYGTAGVPNWQLGGCVGCDGAPARPRVARAALTRRARRRCQQQRGARRVRRVPPARRPPRQQHVHRLRWRAEQRRGVRRLLRVQRQRHDQ